MIVVFGALALFLGLRLLALFKSDHVLLGWLAGGTEEPVPVPVTTSRDGGNPRRDS
jgi:hypothetical protein